MERRRMIGILRGGSFKRISWKGKGKGIVIIVE